MTGFVFGHFVYRIVNGIVTEFFGTFGNAHLVGASTALGIFAGFEVFLRVPNNLTEEFGKFRSVFGLFPSIAFESLGNFGISFTVGLTAHGQIHTHLGAFAHEVSFKTFHNLGIFYDTVADMVLGDELESLTVIYYFFEFRCRNTALRTTFGSLIAFVYITTYGADKFLFHDCFGFLGLIIGVYS